MVMKAMLAELRSFAKATHQVMVFQTIVEVHADAQRYKQDLQRHQNRSYLKHFPFHGTKLRFFPKIVIILPQSSIRNTTIQLK
jgi:hypothetical protein